MIEITKEQFEDIALKAFSRIPAPFQKILNNVDGSIEDWPSEEQIESLDISSRYDLYGLYSGLPLNERGYVETALPNLIVLFQGPIQYSCDSMEELTNQIKTTLLHEIGHYIGLDEKILNRLGYS